MNQLVPDSGILSFTRDINILREKRDDLSGEQGAMMTPQSSPPNP